MGFHISLVGTPNPKDPEGSLSFCQICTLPSLTPSTFCPQTPKASRNFRKSICQALIAPPKQADDPGDPQAENISQHGESRLKAFGYTGIVRQKQGLASCSIYGITFRFRNFHVEGFTVYTGVSQDLQFGYVLLQVSAGAEKLCEAPACFPCNPHLRLAP